MTAIAPKYSAEQRLAVQQCGGDRNVRPYRVIAELAARGELTADGELIGPFDIAPTYCAEIVRTYLRKRAGKEQSKLSTMPPADAIEALRRRLINAGDKLLERYEKRKRSPSAAELREIARTVREIAAIPGPGGQRALGAKPSTGSNVENGPSLASTIKRAASGQRSAAPPAPSDPLPNPQDTLPPRIYGDSPSTSSEERTDGEPGSYVRGALAESLPT